MPAPATPPSPAGAWKPFATHDRRILLLAVLVQLALALPFGHSYDQRIFMATGYLVGNGHNPYSAQNLIPVFHHADFNSISSVGYPPPWPLMLGVLYRGAHAVSHDLLVYNLAIKLPVIAANVALAYLVAAILSNLGARPAVARKAWVFMLFNPLLLYFGAAWGQIDSIVALFSLAALALLYAKRSTSSALMLALAVCFKPTALPVLAVALYSLASTSFRQALRYLAVFVSAALVFCVTPFLVLGWSPTPILERWNGHFIMSGSMSPMTVVRLFRDPLLMQQGRWWLLGLVWLPALVVVLLALRRGDGGFEDLLKKSLALTLVFFLTRTWLAEPNVIAVLPMALILTSMGRLDRRALTALWVLPLAFTVFNASPLQLLWVTFPEAMERALTVAGRYGDTTLAIRAALVIGWQVAGWWIVVTCLRRDPVPVKDGGSVLEGLTT